ncbi:16018_t:CDS:2, partial [Funneliformis geosporum]
DDNKIKENNELNVEIIGPTNLPMDTILKSKRIPVKRIIPEVQVLLECMFHIGIANLRQIISAKEMRDKLLRCEHEGKLTWMIFLKNQLLATRSQHYIFM